MILQPETYVSGCRIINMSSVSGLFGNFGQVNYGAAKEGIAGFTRSLALEVAKYKCTVNTISPGAATRLTIDLIEAAGRKYDENDWTQGPGQIAPVVAWLCTKPGYDWGYLSRTLCPIIFVILSSCCFY